MRTRLALLAAVVAATLGMGQAGTRPKPAELVPLVDHAGVHASAKVRVVLQVHLDPALHAQSDRPRDPGLIPTTLIFVPPTGVTVTEIVFPPSTDIRIPGYDLPLAVFEHDFVIGAELALAANVPAGDLAVATLLRYQACNDAVCFVPVTVRATWTIHVVPAAEPALAQFADAFGRVAFGRGRVPLPSEIQHEGPYSGPAPPNTGAADKYELAGLANFTILDSKGGYMGAADFLQFIHDAEAGKKAKGLFEGRGPLAILLLVFVGGLALNLTPCVLPMIPINLAIIGAGTQAGRKSRGLALGAVYGGAMALVYGVLGLVVILTAGTFGTINASPWFNAGIAALFIVLGLAMFDVIAIDFTRFSRGIRFGESSRGTFLLAFAMGAIAALLAGACVAPVVIEVVLFSSSLYAAGSSAALALPFVLGLGMALPWPIAGAGLASLPKPGAWMNKVKYAFGVFILATAAYYGYVAYGLFANRWVDPASVRASVDAQIKSGWHASLAEGLAAAERDKTPVLIDLWATWCKNCLTMDETTLKDPAVVDALKSYTRIKFQAEDPDRPPAKELMQRVGAVGLPTYVILKHRD